MKHSEIALAFYNANVVQDRWVSLYRRLRRIFKNKVKKQLINEIEINGSVYVLKGSNQNAKAEDLNGMPYVIIRTYSAGVHAGYLKSRSGKEVELLHARRLWYWEGAASLSQLATDGTSKPDKCKFPCEVSRIELTEAIEVLECTKKAQESINNVSIWKQ